MDDTDDTPVLVPSSDEDDLDLGFTSALAPELSAQVDDDILDLGFPMRLAPETGAPVDEDDLAHSAVTKPRLRRASRGTIYHVLDGWADHGPIK